MREFTRVHTGHSISLLSVDTRDGVATASLYDIMRYPAVLALADDGQLIKLWDGDYLPLMNEVAYYAH